MNGQSQHAGITKQKIEKPIYKFLIGFIGGFSAAIFPRLMAALALFEDNDVILLSMGYLYIAVLFAVLIGAVVMIMEWGVPKEPNATFMTALGLPALLAGALNTSNGAYVLDAKSKENLKLTEVVRSLSQIPEISADEIIHLSSTTDTINSSNLIRMNIISEAYADSNSSKQQSFNFNPSMKTQQQQYYIILEEVASKSKANQRTREIKPSVQNAQSVQIDDNYFVIDSKTRSKSDAVLESIRLKNKGFNPVLLKKN